MGSSPAPAAKDGGGGSVGADRIRRIMVALGCFAVLAYMTYEAFGFGVEPRRAPLVIGVPATILCFVLLVREILGKEAVEAAEESAIVKASDEEGEEGEEASEDQLTTLGAALWIAVLATLFLLFGFLVTTVAFPLVFMRIYGKESWKTIAITVVSVFAATYVFFIIVLEIQVYRGIIPIPGLDELL